MERYRETYRETDRQTDRQTCRQNLKLLDIPIRNIIDAVSRLIRLVAAYKLITTFMVIYNSANV